MGVAWLGNSADDVSVQIYAKDFEEVHRFANMRVRNIAKACMDGNFNVMNEIMMMVTKGQAAEAYALGIAVMAYMGHLQRQTDDFDGLTNDLPQ